MMGGIVSKKLHSSRTSLCIMGYGLQIIMASVMIFSCFALLNHYQLYVPSSLMIVVTILCQMMTMFGVCMATSNALALALTEYKWCIGTASSLFGCFYYCFISLFTFCMGFLHNGTLLPMPLYFLALACFMFAVSKAYLRIK